MSLPIVFHPDAGSEYDEAHEWFESRRVGSGDDFEAAVEDALTLIAAHPRMHGVVVGDYRRAPVTGYPYYRVIYRDLGDHVRIISIFHTSRDPATWQGRA